jgi:hypothetical protein
VYAVLADVAPAPTSAAPYALIACLCLAMVVAAVATVVIVVVKRRPKA